MVMQDREIDALVAEHVMGWRWVEHGGFDWIVPPDVVPDIAFFMWGHRIHDDKPQFSGEFENVLPHYSTDIAAAWKVVEAMRAAGYSVSIGYYANGCDVGITARNSRAGWEAVRPVYGGHADTAPRAICIAALRAKGVNVD
jgi:hypothetical protein